MPRVVDPRAGDAVFVRPVVSQWKVPEQSASVSIPTQPPPKASQPADNLSDMFIHMQVSPPDQ